MQEILKPQEVAKMLNVTVKTLQRWDREKRLIAFRNPLTNRRYYTREQIEELLTARKITRRKDNV